MLHEVNPLVQDLAFSPFWYLEQAPTCALLEHASFLPLIAIVL
jgi:hypothetical protein